MQTAVMNFNEEENTLTNSVLKCSWSENGFDTISKSNIWNTQFQNFRCLQWKLLILQARKVELFYLQKWSGDWNRIYWVVTSVCVFRFVYTLPLRRNSEVNKISSDSESNSFANLLRISDKDIMEEDWEDVEESLTHKLTSRSDVTWHFDRAIQMPFVPSYT